MKKIHKWIWMLVLFLPMLIVAAPPTASDGLKAGREVIASTGTLFGVLVVVVTVALWMMPAAFAVLVYTGQKKKAEQMHEEVGLKAAILALLAAVIGVAMAFYIVGTIGIYAEKGVQASAQDNLKGGNTYFLQAVIGTGAKQM